ncbi:hypothetical protein ISF_08644 [Cordyceps fumosorosea ARSEF 2679]|uniref:Uncharacterized protein n=1 Tax=Cordyceps fumosorosea (strain ARSEF 2679) TaxID=1081104 RepID=A0A162I8G3_CORFA|nr:hypothetical protein ISF_08644 [Cordyceps fumosorosea ARSEF 2679]OAA53705.1 hypothetical protein ISF_08644 [Cordyceps fumosorosea ARSEF 2679]
MNPLSRARIPEICCQPESVDFIENDLEDSHPGLNDPPSHYDARRRLFVLSNPVSQMDEQSLTAYNRVQWALKVPGVQAPVAPPGTVTLTLPSAATVLSARRRAEPSAALKFWDELFAPSMDRFVLAHPQEADEVRERGSIRGQHDWTGVFDTLEAAKNAYSQTDKSFKGIFRKVYRKSADHSGTSVVKMAKEIVDNDYASPVLGSLQLVLEAAAKAAKLRQDMLGAFDRIDRNFAEVEAYRQAFAGDENITDAAIGLVAAVLHAVEMVIGFFVSKTYKRLFRATFTIDEYRRKIDTSLTDIDQMSSDLLSEVHMSEVHRDQQFQERVIQDAAITQYGMAQLAHMEHGTRNGIMYMLNDLMLAMKDVKESVSRSPSPAPVMPIMMIAGAPSSPGPEHHGISPHDLLGWINMTDLAAKDLEYIGSHNHSDISDDEQGRAQQLVAHHQLQYWLSVPASSQLLVHGNFGGGLRPVSGLTLFCASLTIHLSSQPRIIRLLFFCGLHIDEDDEEEEDDDDDDDDVDDEHLPVVGGRALIASFVCQLLCAFDFGPELPLDHSIEDAVRDGDVHELCLVFGALVRRLPHGIVLVCVVEGSGYYERPEFLAEASVVLAYVLRLSTDDAVSAIIKVLITSPTRTTHIRQPFTKDKILSMAAMADAEWEPSHSRMERVLGEVLSPDDEYDDDFEYA